jgi:hypothetical protein
MIRKNTDWKREGFLSQSQVKKSNHWVLVTSDYSYAVWLWIAIFPNDS